MKKSWSLLFTLSMLFLVSLTACGSSQEATVETTTTTSQPATTTTEVTVTTTTTTEAPRDGLAAPVIVVISVPASCDDLGTWADVASDAFVVLNTEGETVGTLVEQDRRGLSGPGICTYTFQSDDDLAYSSEYTVTSNTFLSVVIAFEDVEVTDRFSSFELPPLF